MPKVPFLTAGRERTLEPRDKLKDRTKKGTNAPPDKQVLQGKERSHTGLLGLKNKGLGSHPQKSPGLWIWKNSKANSKVKVI